MKFEDIQRVNETIKTLDVKGKEYAEVNQRIKAFRMLYPEGTIETEMLSNENGVCIFKASIIIPLLDDEGKLVDTYLLGTGHAYEKENSTFINKTSYIENCETSAVGRALAMCGIGIDTSIASAEEVQNAINNQVSEEEAKEYKFGGKKHPNKTIMEVLEEDPNYLQWWLDNGKEERVKQMITLLTGMTSTVIPSEEEQQKRFNLLKQMQDLIDKTNTDYEAILKHFGVESNSELTDEQMEEAIKIMESKL